MKVTVFGGSQPKPGDLAYDEAYRLGQMLGKAGHTVLTGGYVGVMEAVSRGAAETGAHVIGVTCEEIERWRMVEANKYVIENMRFPTLSARLMALVFNCDAAIALPGGVGTLAEIAMYWNHLAIEAFPPRPLILVGPGWKNTFQTLLSELGSYVAPRDQGFLQFAENIDEAYRLIQQAEMKEEKK